MVRNPDCSLNEIENDGNDDSRTLDPRHLPKSSQVVKGDRCTMKEKVQDQRLTRRPIKPRSPLADFTLRIGSRLHVPTNIIHVTG
jgi:hypothetical protein